MARGIAGASYRALDLAVSGAAVTNGLNYLGAVKELISQLEYKYQLDPENTPDLVGVTTFISGNIPHEGYAVTITTDYATGSYTVDYVETRPNATNDVE